MGKKRFFGYFSRMLTRPFEEVSQEIARGLADAGFAIVPGLLSESYCAEVRSEIEAAREANRFRTATVGKRGEDSRASHPEIRRDGTLWFEPSALTPIQTKLWDFLEAVRSDLNRSLFLGLWDLEGHYAVYEPGAFYRKHLDRFRNDSRRMVSAVVFFNSGWRSEDGGHLVLDLPEGPQSVAPAAGTVVFFLSERILHGVQETRRNRFSFAGWYRTRSSIPVKERRSGR